MNHPTVSSTYGLMAEFENPEDLLAAAHKTHSAGFRRIDAFSPVPVHGLAAAIGFHRTNLPVLTFVCGLLGAVCGYGLQYWIHVIDYPINVGGRPLHSGPSFISCYLRVDDSVRRNRNFPGPVDRQPAAHALSPGFQRTGVCPRHPGPVFPLHRVRRSAVRRRRDALFSSVSQPGEYLQCRFLTDADSQP